MKLILCKPNEKAKVVELPEDHNYKDIKALLEIDSPMDCVSRMIGKKFYDFWVDDEGLLKEDKKISGLLHMKGAHEVICGNILIALHDNEGNVVGLEEEDIENIMKNGFICENNYEFLTFSGSYSSNDGENYLIIYDYDGFGKIHMNKNGQMLTYGF